MIEQRDLIEKNDWTNLIIMDGGRYDIFQELYPEYLKGTIQQVWNGGVCCTRDWVHHTFRQPYRDVSYYASVPLMDEIITYPSMFGWVMGHRFTRFDQSHPYRIPFSINRAVKRDPIQKRKILHYMAPHPPYIEERGAKRLVGLIKNDILDPDRLRELYTRKYRVAFEATIQILPCLDKNVIVTSDHGECLLDCGQIFHTRTHSKHPHLVTVPWFEVRE